MPTSPSAGRASRRPRGDRGISALELAFIAPSLLLLIFFVIQAALYFYGRSVALQAAREGVSQLRLARTYSEYRAIQESVATDVEDFASSVGSGALNSPSASSDYDGPAGRVTVTVTGSTISLVPFLHLSVTQQAGGQVERFRTP